MTKVAELSIVQPVGGVTVMLFVAASPAPSLIVIGAEKPRVCAFADDVELFHVIIESVAFDVSAAPVVMMRGTCCQTVQPALSKSPMSLPFGLMIKPLPFAA